MSASKRKRKKKVVCVFSADRTEYSLLRPVIMRLKETFDVRILVAGMHLSPEYGYSVEDIRKDGLQVHKCVETLLGSDSPVAASKAMALGLIGFADYFADLVPDLLMVLGDRGETLAASCAALRQGVPIAHINGGETTKGSPDEAIRHAITKLSCLHFTGTEIYRQRVIQLGEAPERVHNVGALALETIMQSDLLSREKVAQLLKIDLDIPYAVVSFHPASQEQANVTKQFSQVLKALRKHRELKYVFTYAKADVHGRTINRMIDAFDKNNHSAAAFVSLDTVSCLSAIKHAAMIIGNSEGGIFEAPVLGIPTVNVGDRQKGRLQSGSIINCPPDEEAVSAAISRAQDPDFLKNMEYRSALYGDGESSQKIGAVIEDYLGNGKVSVQKEFYDLL
ncbi:MAG: UDP-N-acetylglucosamine 2-epimerase [Gracilibacteraceae bacterium]|jgi:GDP/UDP-N,N'-diacetylbacillosamine 2-epimerase (hydrolysing)|nr:UDP-N-acetylglucosamine 2-epimerase [Gracilibacteraceae bacterium]